LGVFVSRDGGQRWSPVAGSPQIATHTLEWIDGQLWVGTSQGLWRLVPETGQWDHLIDQPLWIVSIVAGGNHIFAGGDAIFQIPAGSEPVEIVPESIWNLDVTAQDDPSLIISTIGGDILRWQPGDSRLEVVSDNTGMGGVESVFVVRVQPGNPGQIWAGTDNGLFQGEARWR